MQLGRNCGLAKYTVALLTGSWAKHNYSIERVQYILRTVSAKNYRTAADIAVTFCRLLVKELDHLLPQKDFAGCVGVTVIVG